MLEVLPIECDDTNAQGSGHKYSFGSSVPSSGSSLRLSHLVQVESIHAKQITRSRGSQCSRNGTSALPDRIAKSIDGPWQSTLAKSLCSCSLMTSRYWSSPRATALEKSSRGHMLLRRGWITIVTRHASLCDYMGSASSGNIRLGDLAHPNCALGRGSPSCHLGGFATLSWNARVTEVGQHLGSSPETKDWRKYNAENTCCSTDEPRG